MAYQVPATTSFSVLMKLVQTRVDAAKDYAWELRQDPDFYLEAVKLFSNHYSGIGQATRGHGNIWQGSIFGMASLSCSVVLHWSEVQESLQDVLDLDEELRSNLVGDDFPKEYSDAIIALVDMLGSTSNYLRSSLKNAVYFSPPLNHLWVEDPDVNMSKALVVKQLVPRSDRLPALLSLVTRDRIGYQVPLHQIIDEIEQLIAKDSTQRARITPTVSNLLADIGVIEELNRQVRQHHRKLYYPYCPWHQGQSGKSKAVDSKFASNSAMLISVWQALSGIDLSKYGSPANGRFHYPAEKQRTKHHTLQMRRAEQHLDSLWKKIDTTIKDNFGGRSLGDLFPTLDFSDLTLQRTPDWKPAGFVQAPKIIDTLLDSSIFHTQQHSAGSKFELPSFKTKKKTHGTATTETKQDVAPSVPSTKRQIFHLKPRDSKSSKPCITSPRKLSSSVKSNGSISSTP